MNGENLEFASFNFKLAVIQELIYNLNILLPKYDVYQVFGYDYVNQHGYQEIAEVKAYFEQLVLIKPTRLTLPNWR